MLIVSLMFLSCHTARAGLIGATKLTGAAPPAAHAAIFTLADLVSGCALVAPQTVALRAVLEEHADSPILLDNLAQTLADRGRPAEALDTIEQALPVAGPYAAAVQETYDAVLAVLRERESAAAPAAADSPMLAP